MVYKALQAANPGTKFAGLKTDTMSHVQRQLEHLENLVLSQEFHLTSAQILALNGTPVTVVAAPGAGLALIFEGAMLYKPAGTAYAGIAAGEDLAFKYTDGSGLQVGSCEATGFLDQTTVQRRWVHPYRAASSVSDITPVANSPLVIQMLTGEITTGNMPLKILTLYRVVSMDLSYILTTQTTG